MLEHNYPPGIPSYESNTGGSELSQLAIVTIVPQWFCPDIYQMLDTDCTCQHRTGGHLPIHIHVMGLPFLAIATFVMAALILVTKRFHICRSGF